MTTTENGRVCVKNMLATIANDTVSRAVDVRFVQLEHRGGFCDCWAMANLSFVLVPNSFDVSNNTTEISMYYYSKLCGRNSTFHDPAIMDELSSIELSNLDVVAGFCQDSASIPREFVAKFGSNVTSRCDDQSVKETPTNCSESEVKV